MQASRSQAAYEHILEKLKSGRLPPDAPLVNRTLAKELGISAIPVREAISRLASEGLVAHVSGGGARVRRLDRQEWTELQGLREALETHAVAEAARCITDAELAELDEVCTSWRAVARELKGKTASRTQMARWLDHEEAFHALVIAAARNRWLSKAVANIRLLTQVFHPLREAPELLTAVAVEETCEQHVELVECLRNRDSEAARRSLAAQLRVGVQRMLKYFRERQFS